MGNPTSTDLAADDADDADDSDCDDGDDDVEDDYNPNTSIHFFDTHHHESPYGMVHTHDKHWLTTAHICSPLLSVMTRGYMYNKYTYIYIYNWLVVWNMFFHILESSSSQLTNSIFSKGFCLNHQPDTIARRLRGQDLPWLPDRGDQSVQQNRVGICIWMRTAINIYPLVNKHSYGKWPFILDFPIKNSDFL